MELTRETLQSHRWQQQIDDVPFVSLDPDSPRYFCFFIIFFCAGLLSENRLGLSV